MKLERLLYGRLYEEAGADGSDGGGAAAPAAAAGGTLDGGADGSGAPEGAPVISDEGSNTLNGGENGDGVQLLAGKYKTPDELEKGYKESVALQTKTAEKAKAMEEKLKGFSGAPEGDYELEEGIQGFNSEVMSELNAWGKENGLSQDAYANLVETIHAADVRAAEETRAAEMAKLGTDAQVRIDNINDKLTAIFGDELAAQYRGIGRDAEGVEALESLISRFGEGTVNPDGTAVAATEPITQLDLDEMMHRKDSAGMMLMQTNPEYAKEVYAKMELYNKQKGM